MKYYWLTPKDQKRNNWILHRETTSGVSLRSEYADLQCNKCLKVDELAAIERGIDADVSIHSRSDFLTSDDGLVAVSKRFRDSLASHNVSSVSFVSIPASGNYFIMLPNSFAPIISDNVGMEFHRECPACGRFRETCFFPVLESFAVNLDPLALNAPEVNQEKAGGRQFWFCGSNELVSVLKRQKFKGLEFTEAY